MNRISLTALLLLLLTVPLAAQAPSEAWRTLSTRHFRIHYPAQYEAWALRAASRIESVRDAVVKEVGYAPGTITDVLVMNPVADPNGVTLPLLGHPRILLFPEPPDPETGLGEFANWIDLLTVHETAHLVHLLRPSRNTLQRLVEHVLPLNPITLAAPRWVMEGYATVVEGRITGAGRPSSSIRAAILRKWAAGGQLPTYAQLASDRRFLGMSMAYLAGSAYLEWLEERGGRGSLQHLWARMTARQKRTFGEAFAGVFGDSPEHLYGVFAAELTQRAVDVDKEPLVEGDLWLETKRATGDPAVSPDGSQIAIVERDEKGESKLTVYSTGPNEEEKKFEERIAKMLKRDREDVAPVRTKPLPRKPAHTFQPVEGGDLETPRWTRDGKQILYTHKQPDRDGFLHHDLFIWTPATGENRRLTHLADVSDADPTPDGRSAIAVRSRFGASQLVKIDLTTGAIADVTGPSIDRIVSHPRVAPDGRVAWTEHDASGWYVVVDGIRRGDGFDPEWGSDGALFTVVAGGGFIDIARNGEPVTRTAGAAFQPAPAADGSLFFMSLEPDGYVVRRIAKPVAVPRALPENTTVFVPALPPQASAPVAFAAEQPAAPRAYGMGRQERGLMFGGDWTAYGHRNEFGVRLGDVVGRLDTIAMIANGDDRGQAIASTWRGLPVAITAHAFRLPGERGLELRGEYEMHAPGSVMRLEAGASSRAFGGASLALQQRKTAESLRIVADSDRHTRATISAAARLGDLRVRLTADGGRRLTLGGFTSSVVPQSLRVERIDDPALPRSFAFADRYRSARADVTAGTVTFFWRRYDLSRNVDVRGLEIAVSAPAIPLLKLAALDVTAGAAKVSGMRGVKGWFGLRWRP